MEKILIHKGRPSKVFEKDETHYFYWPIELGFTYWKIGGRKIPIFPLKVKDYEPIKTLNFNGDLVIISRFHYHLLVYFNLPRLQRGKPVADFYFGSHSPFVYSDWSSKSKDPIGSRIRNKMTIDTININEMMQSIAFYSRMFEKSIKNSTFSKLKEYHMEKFLWRRFLNPVMQKQLYG